LKMLTIIGLSLSLIGSVLVGFVGARGIPKAETAIRAPRYKVTLTGWGLIILGVALQIILVCLS
jgi:hypothetical protein